MGSEYVQGIAILIGINLIAVLGLSILTGFTGLFSFGILIAMLVIRPSGIMGKSAEDKA